MTIPQEIPGATAPTTITTGARGLASAITVFLGAYLLLAAFNSPLLSAVLFLATGTNSGFTVSFEVLLFLQFLFAIAVVVAGLLLGRGSIATRLLGSAIVVVGSILTLVIQTLRLTQSSPFPAGREGIPFQMVFGNFWFAIMLVVGVAWLLSRGARREWFVLLAVLILIPIPWTLSFNDVEGGLVSILLFPLSALIGGGIIAASRPWRD